MARLVFRAAATLVVGVGALVPVASPAAGQSASASERRVVDRADRLRQSGRVEEARSELTDLLDRSPGGVEALALLFELDSDAGELARYVPYAEAAVSSSPADDRLRELWVRGLSGAGLADSALAVAARWVETDPSSEAAVLSLAGTAAEVGDADDALEALDRAVDRGLGTRPVHLLRADLRARAGDLDEAAQAWLALLTLEDPAIDAVAEHVGRATDRAAAVNELGDAIERASSGFAAGALVAMRTGDATLARRLAAGVGAEDRSQFLREYVREADLADHPSEVAWAASELIVLSPRPVDKMRWRAMVADRSLAAGDTATAREALEAVASESEPGASPHDVATRQLFTLLAAEPEQREEAARLLDRYVVDYPDSLRARAEMIGQLAAGHARAGDLAAGEALLDRARGELPADPEALGPLDAAGAHLSLWAGARDSAVVRIGRSLAQAGLAAGERTDRIRLSTVVQSADSAEIAVAGAAAFGLHRDPREFDLSPALRELAGLSASAGRPTVLLYLGDRAATAGRPEVASGMWRRVVDAYSQSPEAPSAILSLARGAELDEARQWLERLIVGYPESALAPVARRLLSELNEGAR